MSSAWDNPDIKVKNNCELGQSQEDEIPNDPFVSLIRSNISVKHFSQAWKLKNEKDQTIHKFPPTLFYLALSKVEEQEQEHLKCANVQLRYL